MDQSHRCYAEWKKPDADRYMLRDSICKHSKSGKANPGGERESWWGGVGAWKGTGGKLLGAGDAVSQSGCYTEVCAQHANTLAVYLTPCTHTSLYKCQFWSWLKFKLMGIRLSPNPYCSWRPCTQSPCRNGNVSPGTDLSQRAAGSRAWQILYFVRCRRGSSSKWLCQLGLPLAVNEGRCFPTFFPLLATWGCQAKEALPTFGNGYLWGWHQGQEWGGCSMGYVGLSGKVFTRQKESICAFLCSWLFVAKMAVILPVLVSTPSTVWLCHSLHLMVGSVSPPLESELVIWLIFSNGMMCKFQSALKRPSILLGPEVTWTRLS